MSEIQSFKTSSLDSHSIVTVKGLAELLKIKPQTIRAWLCHDRLPNGLPRPKKINNRNCWLMMDVQNYIMNIFSTKND
ncbi:DNA-binding protein [Salmonella enterica subsp. enterica serovar Westhampton]|nr:DNA-binding protein [Salmonella enterica subsp. enterica serovar Westhampton]EKE2600101.1 DNA-binding protein [Salmonella enterica]